MTIPFPNGMVLNLQEKTILDRLARGWTCKQIAKGLGIGDTSFSITLRIIKVKLQARTKAQAVAIAVFRQQILPFETKIPYPARDIGGNEE